MQYLWVSCKSYISLKAVARGCSINKMFFKISQNSLENTCDGVSFIIMLRAVGSAPCLVYIKDKNSYPCSGIFSFPSQRSDLLFENLILHLHCGVDIRSAFRTLPKIQEDVFCKIS